MITSVIILCFAYDCFSQNHEGGNYKITKVTGVVKAWGSGEAYIHIKDKKGNLIEIFLNEDTFGEGNKTKVFVRSKEVDINYLWKSIKKGTNIDVDYIIKSKHQNIAVRIIIK